MRQIALPKNVSFEMGEGENREKAIIEPCYPGYGITIGNALRRVLLSSLPGAAPVGIKIKGIEHEFQALPHLKEDILEFILNLKKLRIKMHSDEPVKLELKVHGEKEITAGDITKNAEVEIINTELVLGHITDMAGSLDAEITVSKGLGYEMIESREGDKDKEIGFIEMDSIFSPVLAAGIKVDNTRVGKETNWEKVILDIQTDGTITPRRAFEDSVKMLLDQFGALVGTSAEVIIKEKEAKKEAELAEMEKAEQTVETEDIVSVEDAEEPKKKRGRPKKSE